jgi:hypothetical protein
MKFNPINNTLYTTGGERIKTLHCPMQASWQDMTAADDQNNKVCNHCASVIYDTAVYQEEELVTLLKNQPNACLKVDLNQPNLRIITDASA